MFNTIYIKLADYKPVDLINEYYKNNKINKTVTDITPVLPPKENASEEEKKAYADYLETMDALQKAYFEAGYAMMNPDLEAVHDFTYFDEHRKENQASEMIEDNDPLKKVKFTPLTDKEKEARSRVNDPAKKALAKMHSENIEYQTMFNRACKSWPDCNINASDTRIYSCVLSFGCKNAKDLSERFAIMSSGDVKKKQAMFEGILTSMRCMMQDLSYSKDDASFISYMQENGSSVSALSEIDGNKLDRFAECLGVDISPKSRAYKIINDFRYIGNSVGGSSVTRLCVTANPYYSVLKDKDAAFFGSYPITDPDMMFSKNLDEMKETGNPVVNYIQSYSADSFNVRATDMNTDLVKLYLKSHPGVKLYFEDGKVMSNPEDKPDQVCDALFNHNKACVAVDKDGNFLSRIFMDQNKRAGIITDEDQDVRFDFKNHPLETVRFIKNEMDTTLKGYFNHQEFKNLQAYVNSFEKNYKANPDNLNQMVEELGNLAKAYVTSKYVPKDVPPKNDTTYRREVFFNNLYKQTKLYENPEAFRLPPYALRDLKKDLCQESGNLIIDIDEDTEVDSDLLKDDLIIDTNTMVNEKQ